MISIIIVVKDEPKIEETIGCITSSPKPDDDIEIIVVDASNGKLDSIRNKFPDTRWIDYESKKKKKITIPEQRNVGIKVANGNIIVFIDAGCLPIESWLQELTSLILDREEKIVCGMSKSIGSTWFYDFVIKDTKRKKYLSEASTSNFAVGRDVFEDIGLFDESFDYGSDVDWSWRAINKGYKIRYIARAMILHEGGSYFEDIKRSFRYGTARARLYKKHKNRIKNILHTELISVAYPLFLILLPLTLIWPYYPFLLLIPFIKNINNRPFQTIVNHIIYGFGILYEIMQSC